MTLRTSSATRRSVVSRSNVVLTTSATSSSKGSTLEGSSDWVVRVSTITMISAEQVDKRCLPRPCWSLVVLVVAGLTRAVGSLARRRLGKFRSAQIPHDIYPRTGADAVGAGTNHCSQFFSRTHTTRGFDARTRSYHRPHEEDIFDSRATEQAGRCFYEVRSGS